MSLLDFYRLDVPGRTKRKVFACTMPCYLSTTLGSPDVTIQAVAAGRRDPIYEIRKGTLLTSSTAVFTGVVLSVNIATRTVTMSTNAITSQTNILGVFGYQNNFFVPAGVHLIYASWCGAGQSGAGGHASSGWCGGGGAASATFSRVPLRVYPGLQLEVVCGAPVLGGLVGASPLNNLFTGATQRTNIQDTSGNFDFSNVYTKIPFDPEYVNAGYMWNGLFYTPTGRPNLTSSSRAQPGGATSAGKGGDGAPEYGTTLGAAPVGGAGAVGTTPGQAGGSSKQLRGEYCWSGGAGGGGGGPSLAAGEGGSDLMHTDGDITTPQIGGNGGSCMFGKGGVYDSVNGVPGDGRGYGAGASGGGPNGVGGIGAPGCVILEWE